MQTNGPLTGTSRVTLGAPGGQLITNTYTLTAGVPQQISAADINTRRVHVQNITRPGLGVTPVIVSPSATLTSLSGSVDNVGTLTIGPGWSLQPDGGDVQWGLIEPPLRQALYASSSVSSTITVATMVTQSSVPLIKQRMFAGVNSFGNNALKAAYIAGLSIPGISGMHATFPWSSVETAQDVFVFETVIGPFLDNLLPGQDASIGIDVGFNSPAYLEGLGCAYILQNVSLFPGNAPVTVKYFYGLDPIFQARRRNLMTQFKAWLVTSGRYRWLGAIRLNYRSAVDDETTHNCEGTAADGVTYKRYEDTDMNGTVGTGYQPLGFTWTKAQQDIVDYTTFLVATFPGVVIIFVSFSNNTSFPQIDNPPAGSPPGTLGTTNLGRNTTADVTAMYASALSVTPLIAVIQTTFDTKPPYQQWLDRVALGCLPYTQFNDHGGPNGLQEVNHVIATPFSMGNVQMNAYANGILVAEQHFQDCIPGKYDAAFRQWGASA